MQRVKADTLTKSVPTVSSSDDVPSFLPVRVRPVPESQENLSGLLSGISLTLPDGTVVSIRRGSAEAVVSFLRLYTGEGMSCSD